MPAGRILYGQGGCADSIYYLDSGAVAISARSAAGSQTVIGVQAAGTFIGAGSLADERHATTAAALLPSAVMRLTKAVANDLLQSDQDFAGFFARSMMQRARMLEEEQVDRAVNSTRKRLARLLLILASQGSDCEQPVLACLSEEILAQILGAEPNSIRTLLHDFRRARLLAPGEPLVVRSSLVQVLLPAQRERAKSRRLRSG